MKEIETFLETEEDNITKLEKVGECLFSLFHV